MSPQIIACPKCGRSILPKRDGRCPSCQEKIFEAMPEDPPAQSSASPQPATSNSTAGSAVASHAAVGMRVSKGFLVFGILLILVATPLLAESILGDPGSAVRTSRRGRDLEELLGPRATLFVAALGTLAAGLYVTHTAVRQSTRNAKAVGYGLALAAITMGASVIAVPKAVAARERGQLRQVVEEIRPLCETDSVVNEWQTFRIEDKLIIWNCADSDFDPAQEKLPDGRRGSSSDPKVTYLLIVGTQDESGEKYEYDSGKRGYRRTLRIGLINWPDKKPLGVFEIEGDPPPSFLTRREGDGSRIVGDTTAPLLRWIDRQAPSK